MDFVLAGPKMRRWYGEGERMPEDGDMDLPPLEAPPAPKDQQILPPEKRTHVLVTDADSPLGEQVLIQLILARWAAHSCIARYHCRMGRQVPYNPLCDCRLA